MSPVTGRTDHGKGTKKWITHYARVVACLSHQEHREEEETMGWIQYTYIHGGEYLSEAFSFPAVPLAKADDTPKVNEGLRTPKGSIAMLDHQEQA